MKSKISDALDKNLVKQQREIIKKSENIALNKDADEDYECVRQELKKLLETSGEALEELFLLAKESEHPRTFEVLSDLIRTSADLGNQLMDLQKKRHQLDVLNNPEKSQKNAPQTKNTAFFIGSTTDLQRMIQDQSKKTIDVDSE